MRTMVCASRLGSCLAPSHRHAPTPPRSGRLAARARVSRVAATTRETTTIAERAAAGALEGSGPFPLLDPTKGYSHVSPGVCDACADDVEARRAWVRVPPPAPRPIISAPSRSLIPNQISPTPASARGHPPRPRRRPTSSSFPSPPQVALLLGQLPSHRANAERTLAFLGDAAGDDFLPRYRAWEADYEAYLASVSEDDAAPGQGATLLDMVDEKERLLRARGLDDLFAGMKAEENAVAAAIFPALVDELDDAWEPEPGAANIFPDPPAAKAEMLRTVLECCLAGNLFDAGAAAAVRAVADASDASDASAVPPDAASLAEVFERSRARVARSAAAAGRWRYDSLDELIARATTTPWRRAIIFCDNAGADAMGMVLLARALAGLGGAGTKVALAANDTAALNDVTAVELEAFVETVTARGGEYRDGDALLGAMREGNMVTVVPSGQISTLLDLNRTGPELNAWMEKQLEEVPAGEDWLVVLDGMGRSLESNWDVSRYVREGVQTLNLAMIKSQINAERLDAEVYDCVVRLGRGA